MRKNDWITLLVIAVFIILGIAYMYWVGTSDLPDWLKYVLLK